MTLRLRDLVSFLSDRMTVELVGNPDHVIEGLSTLDAATPGDLSFLSNSKYVSKLADSRAGCVLVAVSAREAAVARGSCIVVDDPYHAFALVTQLWKRNHQPATVAHIHPSAVIDPSARIAEGVSVGAFSCVGPQATIGVGATIGAHCVIGSRAVIGDLTCLHPRVTISDGCRVGRRCIVHSGAVIGADGFGFAPHDGRWIKIEQLGAVVVGDDVEIGANTCIDRGALQDTVLEDGVKLDNLVQIGHNVRIGKHSALAGCAGVAGSATIGAHCTVGGGAVVLGHLVLADHVHISAASVVTRSILKPGQYTGLFPIDDNVSWEKNAASLKQLHGLRDRLKNAEKALSRHQNNPEKS